MKKVLVILGLLALLTAGGVWYMLSGAGNFIRAQIEQQGGQYLDTEVTVFSVELALTEGRMTINDLDIKNPHGFSAEDAFSVDAITLDLGEIIKQPYVVQTIKINAPEILYEVDANGKGNLLVLKSNLEAKLPRTENEPATKDGAAPLVIIENVTVSNVRLKLNFAQLPTGDLNVATKVYEITLPTFTAGPIGKPNGMPADKVGIAVVNAMLDNVIAAAKSAGKKRLAEEARKKVDEKLDEQKKKLLEKANDKLKGLFN